MSFTLLKLNKSDFNEVRRPINEQVM